jgi:nucleoside-diphosphate-sugar epimerase
VAYVENVVDATLYLLDRMKPGVEVYNYSDSPHLSTFQLVTLIAEKAGTKVPRFHIPLSVASALARVFDLVGSITGRDFPITSARLQKFNTPTFHTAPKILRAGFVPRFSIEEGIEENVRWYRHEKPSGAITGHSSE